MAEWTNIFDLGDWDIYVKFVGATESPSPDSRYYYVKAADLHPDVGTVSVVNGEIICEMEDASSSGGYAPAIVLLPQFAAPQVQYRVTCTGFDGRGEAAPVISVRDGPAEWDPEYNFDLYFEDSNGFVLPTASPGPLPEGQGISVSNYRFAA